MLRILIDNRYASVGILGCGGMAKVYLARDEFLGRDVALKVLKEEYAFSEEFRERFRREAENAASLSHPNIVAVYDRGEDGPGGMPYIAMEHVPGGTLAERIVKEGSLDALEAAGIARQVALALAEAHRRGVIHRDIKPHNIFLTRDPFDSLGAVKVGDFGIARPLKATTVTDTTFILGSVRYLSPEQAMGEAVGPRSDLYSLGVVLYEMLTGRVPFNGEGPIAIAMKHISELPPSPKQVNPDVPESLEAMAQRLLSKDPAFRYPDALALAEDLAQVARGLRSRAAFIFSPSGSDAFSGGSLSTDRVSNRNTMYSRTRKRRRDLRRRLSATMVGVSALIFAAGASAAAGLYEIPWLADVPQLSGWLTTRSGEETSPPAEKASSEEEASSPVEEASNEPQAEAETKTGANASMANSTSGEESSTTTTPTALEGWGAAEPVAYVSSTNPQIRTSKSEPTSAKSTPKEEEQQRRKDSLETTSNSTEKSSKGVLRSNPGEGSSGDRHASAQGKPSKKGSRATSKK